MAFKKYKEEITAADVKTFLSRGSRDVTRALEAGHDLAEQWNAYKQGKNDAAVEADLGISAAEVTDLKQAFNTLEDLYSIAGGDDTVVIPTGTSNYFRRMREFS